MRKGNSTKLHVQTKETSKANVSLDFPRDISLTENFGKQTSMVPWNLFFSPEATAGFQKTNADEDKDNYKSHPLASRWATFFAQNPKLPGRLSTVAAEMEQMRFFLGFWDSKTFCILRFYVFNFIKPQKANEFRRRNRSGIGKHWVHKTRYPNFISSNSRQVKLSVQKSSTSLFPGNDWSNFRQIVSNFQENISNTNLSLDLERSHCESNLRKMK